MRTIPGLVTAVLVSGLLHNGFTRERQFILGADISWVDAEIDRGQKYYDEGKEMSIFDILREHTLNLIRLRLFVDPSADVPDEKWDSPYSTVGYCGLERTIEFAKNIKEAGMLFSLDLHYSDTWADPGKQHKPMAWRDLSYDDLVKKVRSYTRETLEAFKEEGVLPDIVQIGNEIVGGMIWPDGSTGNMGKFAELVNAGIDGVKDVSDDVEIFIHSLSDKAPGSWLSNLINAGVKAERIDIFGLSYYEEWHGTPNDLKRNLTSITNSHDVHIMVAEYAEVHEQVNEIVFNLPDEKGLGTIIWEPTQWHETLFDNGRTNSRIDLYPELSRKYGNDSLPLKEGMVGVITGFSVTENTAERNNLNSVFQSVHTGVIPSGEMYSIVDLQGKTVATGTMSEMARCMRRTSRSMYLLRIVRENGRQSGGWLCSGVLRR